MVVFEVIEQRRGASGHPLGNASESRDVHAVRLVGAAFDHRMQEHHVVPVLLPAMFGPVSNMMRASGPRAVSLATNWPGGRLCSTTGCRPSVISKASESSTTGR